MHQVPAVSLTDNLYASLKARSVNHQPNDIIVLESQHPDHPESRVTYIAAFPKQRLEIAGDRVVWQKGADSSRFADGPWTALRKFKESSGWVFGYIGYDLASSSNDENMENPACNSAPDLVMMEPEYLFRIDEDGVEQLTGEPFQIEGSYMESNYSIDQLSVGIDKEAYEQAVNQIKHLIAEGDFYELNFSYPITASFDGSPYELYRQMREVNPVPFASYLELSQGELSICCSSPERFLRKRGDTVISEPIKGTAARGSSPEEDEAFRDELKSEKNEAENLMIVDLVRHDLSAVCDPGSIKVSKLFEIQTFGTVHQLISRVEGKVSAQNDPVDVIRACFPMGSMTGAPKIRVMQRIGELENYRRGIYSGAIGYFTPDGDFDFNVVIRTAIISGDRLVYPVGGAITGDSDPHEEWNETKVKSRVLQMVQKQNELK